MIKKGELIWLIVKKMVFEIRFNGIAFKTVAENCDFHSLIIRHFEMTRTKNHSSLLMEDLYLSNFVNLWGFFGFFEIFWIFLGFKN